MDEHRETNRLHWDEIVPIHVASEMYDVAGFKAGRSRLQSIELGELGDVRGKTLLHLQCHFGLDTLSWARHGGAIVTGADFSGRAIETARALAAETEIAARFVQSELYDLPNRLDEKFDVVFTSYGVLGWLPDLRGWARVVAHFLRPGGTFYIVEFHPFAWVFDDAPGVTELRVRYPYFGGKDPLRIELPGDYADPSAPLENRLTYVYPYEIGAVVTSLIEAGLRSSSCTSFLGARIAAGRSRRREQMAPRT